jgi:hypothetical protein
MLSISRMVNCRIEKAARAILVVATIAVGVLAVSMSADLELRDAIGTGDIAALSASSGQTAK